MKINTKYHGERLINENEIITFPNAIPGFQDEKEFIVLSLDEDQEFLVLQSVANSQLAFIMTSPFRFFKEYDFTLDDFVVELLKIESEKDIHVFSILTVQDPFDKTTVNLQAPIVINTKNKLAKQVILNQPDYRTKHPLFSKKKHKVVKG